MLANSFLITFRNLTRQKGFSFINIAGLAVGLACAILIMMYVRHELSYDAYHEQPEDIYRVVLYSERPVGVSRIAATPVPLAAALKQDYPEIDAISRVLTIRRPVLVVSGADRYYEDRFIFADPEFFEIFSVEMLHGDRNQLLASPSSVAISASTARKYFGDENPVNRTIVYDDELELQVSGVFQDIPANSHFSYDFVASFAGAEGVALPFPADNWGGITSHYTYLRLPAGTDQAAFDATVGEFMMSKGEPPGGGRWWIELQPLLDIHLRSHLQVEIQPNAFVSNLVIISTIGIFILLIASINFMNLSTARSLRRSREFGVRKTMGAQRPQLMVQLLAESLLLTFISLGIALVLVELFSPGFANLIGAELPPLSYADPVMIAGTLGIAIALGLASGLYPAISLSSHEPVSAMIGLMGNSSAKRGPLYVRKVLVTLQFGLAALLIVGTLVVRNQLDYMLNANLGFKKDHILGIQIRDLSGVSDYQSFKSELLAYHNVERVSFAFRAPIGGGNAISVAWQGDDPAAGFMTSFLFIDPDYIEMFDIKMLAGRNFSNEITTDRGDAFILNAKAAMLLGYSLPEEAVGELLNTGMGGAGTIVGVTEDFHASSLHEEIGPQVMVDNPRMYFKLLVRVSGEDLNETLAFLDDTVTPYWPAYPLDYSFVDEDIAALYEGEVQTARIIGVCSLITIFIACLGLLGLSAYTAEQRTKEIGIRKVLGASVGKIVGLLSSELVVLIIISNLIAGPIAWLLMNRWLEDFAYREPVNPALFLLTGLLTLVLTLATVSYQALKAATANPVDSIRYE